MTIAEMRDFVRKNRLRGYTRHKRWDDPINFLRNNYQPTPQLQTWEPTRPQCTRPPPPPPSVRFRPDRPKQPELLRQLEKSQRQPSSQEMDIFEQQEMNKSRPQVKNKLNKWYNWIVSHVPDLSRNRQVERSNDKIMG